MSLKWVDAEVLVDEKGRMHVPRVVVAPAPPQIEARNDKPVEFDASRIWRAFPAPLGPEDVEITVAFTSLSQAFPNCSEFSGKVTAVGSKVCSDSFLGKTYVSFVIVLASVNACHTPSEFSELILQNKEAFLSAIVRRLRLSLRVWTS